MKSLGADAAMIHWSLSGGDGLPQSVRQFRHMPGMNCVSSDLGQSSQALNRREFGELLGRIA